LVIRRFGGRDMLTLLALLEPIALAIHLQDMDVVREPVEQGTGEPFGGKDMGTSSQCRIQLWLRSGENHGK
jgi:hypothetical protein